MNTLGYILIGVGCTGLVIWLGLKLILWLSESGD